MKPYLLLGLLALAAPEAHARATITIYNNDRAPGQGTGGIIGAGTTAGSFTFKLPVETFRFAAEDLNGTLILSGSANAANNGAFRVVAVDVPTNTLTFLNGTEGAAPEEAFAGSWVFGEGFNDPMPIAPVGGNTGTTVGEQRLKAFQYAAQRWGEILDSGPEILIRANFNAQACTATSAVLGSAGTTSVFSDFEGAKEPGTWYSAALANKLSGTDNLPPDPTRASNPLGAEINSQFNSSLNGNPACLGARTWYYGFDHNEGPNQNDLLPVLMHEFGHGLGMQSFVARTASATTPIGSYFNGKPDTYSNRLFDIQVNKWWKHMTDAERETSMKNGRRVVWNGPAVLAASASYLSAGTPFLKVNAPSALARNYLVGEAAFGPRLSGTAITGDLLYVDDGVAAASGGTVNDGCEPLVAGSLSGKIALVDRGLCNFTIKVKNAQDAGALAVIVADTAAGGPPSSLTGADATVTIPAVRVMKSDGDAIRASIVGGTAVNVSLALNTNQLAGADEANRVMIYTADPIASGSNVSHFDTSLTPNALMEPSINSDLTTNVDLTLPLFRDIGWYPDADTDRVEDGTDNCRMAANPAQTDTDGDSVGDACDDDDDGDHHADANDNCALVQNPDQRDLDGDQQGDACDSDDDGDGVEDASDNCARVANAGQEDRDSDGTGNACDDADDDGVMDASDNCPDVANTNQANADGDASGDSCDADDDNDGVADASDNCALVANPNQADLDTDSIGDACENDTDGDTVLNGADNCPVNANPAQTDTDSDGTGDVCDADDDGDGVADATDNCALQANANQANTDGDAEGDLCDADDDNDEVADGSDNCPVNANPAKTDTDSDGAGDACDADDDNDRINDAQDNCALVSNVTQTNADNDAQGDVCDADDDGDSVADGSDNCPLVANPSQLDTDKNSKGDACQDDDDGDGVNDPADNCPLVKNTTQVDTNKDGAGDACSEDDDGDRVNDSVDNCPLTQNPDQADNDEDGIGNVCEAPKSGCAAGGAEGASVLLLGFATMRLLARRRRQA